MTISEEKVELLSLLINRGIDGLTAIAHLKSPFSRQRHRDKGLFTGCKRPLRVLRPGHSDTGFPALVFSTEIEIPGISFSGNTGSPGITGGPGNLLRRHIQKQRPFLEMDAIL